MSISSKTQESAGNKSTYAPTTAQATPTGGAAAKAGAPGGDKENSGNASNAELSQQIAAIMRQIAASVTFLPLLDTPCTFDMLVYTPVDLAVPTEWEESSARVITNAQEVRLRSLNTTRHKVDALVSYRVDT